MALIKRRQNVVLFVIPSKVWQEWRVGGGGMPRISPKMNPIRGSSVTVSWTGQQIHQVGSRKPRAWNKSGLSGNRETGQKRGVNEPGRGAGFHKISPDWWVGEGDGHRHRETILLWGRTIGPLSPVRGATVRWKI